MFKLLDGSSFNFTRILLKLLDGSTHEIKLSLDNTSKVKLFQPDRRITGPVLNSQKWYNITISLDTSRDELAIYFNNSQIFFVNTASKLFLLREVYLQLGVFDCNSTMVKTLLDEFSMLVSPVVFTDKPVYMSSSSVRVDISGDQFYANSLTITVESPSGSIIEKTNVNANLTGGFSYSLVLSNPPAGTYTIRVNSSSCAVEYHFGVWNVPREWERKSKIYVAAGGFMPGSQVTLHVRNQTHEIFNWKLTLDDNGEVNESIIPPANLQTGSLNFFLKYYDTFDFKNMGGVTETMQITVLEAVLNVTVITNADIYERTQSIQVEVFVKYKDGSSISSNGIVRMKIYAVNFDFEKDVFIDYRPPGYWTKNIPIAYSDPNGTYLIKVYASDEYGNSGSGNKTIVVTAAKLNITLVDQLNESYERSTRINISVRILYPSGDLVESGNVRLEMIRGSSKEGPFDFVARNTGEWSISHKIPRNVETGEWILRITARDEAGNMGELYPPPRVRILPANISIRFLSPSNTVFSRTESISVKIVATYPSNEHLQHVQNSVVEAILVPVQTDSSPIGPFLLRPYVDGWVGNISAPRNATVGQYFLKIYARDPYGNNGSEKMVVEVTKATLRVDVEDLKDTYQVGFDTINMKLVVKYPDGSLMSDGSVNISILRESLVDSFGAEPENGKWVGEYYLSLTIPAGDYMVLINVTDPYGNAGVKEVALRVSNLYVILIIVSITVTLATSVSLLLIIRRRRRIPSFPKESGLNSPYEDYVFG
ncbi:MAG: hypothetical protein ACUVQ0_02445 [Thermoproteota archaeon]